MGIQLELYIRQNTTKTLQEAIAKGFIHINYFSW